MHEQQIPDVGWLDSESNPWPIPVLDVRPVTQGMLSTTRDPRCAANALSFSQDDGAGFIGVQPPKARTAAVDLQFRIDRFLADGALFIPTEMEHKWALYYHGGRILCIRSWQRQVQAVAECRLEGERLKITAVRGTLVDEDEDPGFTERVLDYLIRSHALDMEYPVPCPMISQKTTELRRCGAFRASATGLCSQHTIGLTLRARIDRSGRFHCSILP